MWCLFMPILGNETVVFANSPATRWWINKLKEHQWNLNQMKTMRKTWWKTMAFLFNTCINLRKVSSPNRSEVLVCFFKPKFKIEKYCQSQNVQNYYFTVWDPVWNAVWDVKCIFLLVQMTSDDLRKTDPPHKDAHKTQHCSDTARLVGASNKLICVVESNFQRQIHREPLMCLWCHSTPSC